MVVRKEAADSNAALEQAYEKIRGLLGEAVRDEVRTRHQVGVLLSTIHYATHTYGERAVERLARKLEMSTDTLYRSIHVAENWSPDALEELQSHTNRRGEPLSWSHLVVLTRATTDVSRRRWAQRCLEGCWSVRDLTDAMTRERDEGPPGASSVRPAGIAIREGMQNAARATAQLSVVLDAMVERLAEESNQDEALLAEAIETYEALRGKVDDTLQCLRQTALSSAKRVRARVRLQSEADEEAEEEEGHEGSGGRGRGMRVR